ncbi:hypothetical protein [Brevundimonas sp. LjRoot202]|uniref:hypothetical protein n=1 Tax=Brevundimonas sp. LjRoot202 TaxID=3342281 RepID=UPI003ECCA512
MTEKRFLQGFLAALLSLGLIVLGLQILMTRVGEIDFKGVVDRQLAAPNGEILFLSGLNQNAYHYKIMLFDRVSPEAVAIGSSRAMEVRGEFFNTRFVTMGGAINNLQNLETIAEHVARTPTPPQLALVYVDPWLFNARYTDNQAPVPDVPKLVSADMLFGGLKALRHGNWLGNSLRSRNLGIYALINDEGYARDGSQYYLGTQNGSVASSDVRFVRTFGRIEGDKQNFQRNTRADPALVARICAAVKKIRRRTRHVVVVAPPFATPIWARLSQPDYAYIQDGYEQLSACVGDASFFSFVDPASIRGGTDCEFVDGLHGGDVTYARMLNQIGEADPETRRYLRADFLTAFIERYKGHAGGSGLALRPGMKEVDFLGLGCRK